MSEKRRCIVFAIISDRFFYAFADVYTVFGVSFINHMWHKGRLVYIHYKNELE